jgi:hypothetical protein
MKKYFFKTIVLYLTSISLLNSQIINSVLKLSNTKITGNSIGQLSLLTNLKRLYLVNSSFEEKFIGDLLKLKNLEKVYLFQEKNPLKTRSIIPMEKLSVFDFGNYKLEDL